MVEHRVRVGKNSMRLVRGEREQDVRARADLDEGDGISGSRRLREILEGRKAWYESDVMQYNSVLQQSCAQRQFFHLTNSVNEPEGAS